MPRLPYTRVVEVSLTRQDRFATATGFSVALLVQPLAVAGLVDAAVRTRVYGDITEVAVDFPADTEAYKAASFFFMQNPRPRQLKIGYRNSANPIASELDAIYEYDPDFYWLGFTSEIRDTAAQRAAADWAESHFVLSGHETMDTDTETPAAATDPTGTFTVTVASPAVVSWTGHGLAIGDPFIPTTSGALPTGLVAGQTYYVIAAGFGANAFQVSATAGGSAVNTSGTQSGTHTGTSPRYGGSFAEYIEQKSYDRSFAFYTITASEYPAMAALAYAAGRDLDRGNLRAAMRGDIDSGNAYTLKFKTLRGITPLNKASAAVQAITGFVPGIGIDPAQGHRANAYVDIGGVKMIVEGSVGSGAFIDEIHVGDWLVARTREALLSAFAVNDRVPMTNPGGGILTNAVETVMRRGIAAGIVAGDVIEEEDGQLTPEYRVSIERVENIPASQRRNRIAPDIRVDFRYAGAMHYASAAIIMRF